MIPLFGAGATVLVLGAAMFAKRDTIYKNVKDETSKLYTESKNKINEYTSNMPANTIVIVPTTIQS